MSTPLTSGYLYALYDVLDFNAQLRDGDEDRVWTRLLEKLAVALDVEAATYFTFMPKTRILIARYALGVAARKVEGAPIDIGAGIIGWVAEHREPLIIDDPYDDERFIKEFDKTTGFKTKNILALPLNDRLELTGVIELMNKRGGAFTPEDYRFTEAACRATAMTLRNFKIEARVDKVTAHNASIIENLGGGFLAIDLHGRLILCNPSAKNILSLPMDLPLNLPVEQALEKVPVIADILMKTASSRKTAKRQDLTCTIDGEEKAIGYSTMLIQDPRGNLSGAGIIFQDITKKKRQDS